MKKMTLWRDVLYTQNELRSAVSVIDVLYSVCYMDKSGWVLRPFS